MVADALVLAFPNVVISDTHIFNTTSVLSARLTSDAGSDRYRFYNGRLNRMLHAHRRTGQQQRMAQHTNSTQAGSALLTAASPSSAARTTNGARAFKLAGSGFAVRFFPVLAMGPTALPDSLRYDTFLRGVS
jgi:hypothetical protein